MSTEDVSANGANVGDGGTLHQNGNVTAGADEPSPQPQQPRRRRSIREQVEPERFIARPSQQGLSAADGDQVFLAGGIMGGMARGGDHGFVVSNGGEVIDPGAIESLGRNDASTSECETVGWRSGDAGGGVQYSHLSSPLALLAAAATRRQDVVAKSTHGRVLAATSSEIGNSAEQEKPVEHGSKRVGEDGMGMVHNDGRSLSNNEHAKNEQTVSQSKLPQDVARIDKDGEVAGDINEDFQPADAKDSNGEMEASRSSPPTPNILEEKYKAIVPSPPMTSRLLHGSNNMNSDLKGTVPNNTPPLDDATVSNNDSSIQIAETVDGANGGSVEVRGGVESAHRDGDDGINASLPVSDAINADGIETSTRNKVKATDNEDGVDTSATKSIDAETTRTLQIDAPDQPSVEDSIDQQEPSNVIDEDKGQDEEQHLPTKDTINERAPKLMSARTWRKRRAGLNNGEGTVTTRASSGSGAKAAVVAASGAAKAKSMQNTVTQALPRVSETRRIPALMSWEKRRKRSSPSKKASPSKKGDGKDKMQERETDELDLADTEAISDEKKEGTSSRSSTKESRGEIPSPDNLNKSKRIDGLEGRNVANGVLPKMRTRKSTGTPKPMFESEPESDLEEITISALQKSVSPERRLSGRQRRKTPTLEEKSIHHDDCLDEDEVKFIFSSPGRSSRSLSSSSRTTRKSPHSSENFLRRSKRGSTPPAKLRTFPLISSTAEEENEMEEAPLDDTKSHYSGEIRVHRSPKLVCVYKDCMKFKQSSCEGYCMAHFKSLPSASSRKSGKKRTAKGSPKSHQKLGKRKQPHVEDQESAEKAELQASKKCNTICKTNGCKKYMDEKKHNTPKATKPKESIDTISSSGRGRSGRVSNIQSSPEELSRSHFSKRTTDVQNLFQKGSPVVVKDRRVGRGVHTSGGVGRVTNVYQTTNRKDSSVKYDIAYILGGEGKDVDARHVSPSYDKSLIMPMPDAKESKAPAAKYKPLARKEKGSVCEDDDFSFSDLELQELPSDTTGPRRELNLDIHLSAQNSCNQTHWRCSRCGDLNSSKSRCSTCRHNEGVTSETALLERTRFELLNGRDFWHCIDCAVGVQSITTPCGGCKRMISFVPLEIGEFEEFVQKQRNSNKKKAQEWQHQWQRRMEELQEEWSDEEEDKNAERKSSVNLDYYKNGSRGIYGKFFCKYHGCRATNHPNGKGFCGEHFRAVLDGTDPTPFPLVLPEDRELVTESVYLALEQTMPCNYGSSERKISALGDVLTGYPGLACKHCKGEPGTSGRWFPSSERAMYTSSFTMGIISHVRNCPHCPTEVKETLLDQAKDKAKAKGTPANKKGSGSRTKFIHRLWCRVQRIPLVEAEITKGQPLAEKQKISSGKKRKKGRNDSEAKCVLQSLKE